MLVHIIIYTMLHTSQQNVHSRLKQLLVVVNLKLKLRIASP
jgi:hypothetical protein